MTQSITLLQRILFIVCALLGMWGSANAQDEVRQIKLTEAQVKSFISAQADLAAIATKI